MKTYNYDGFIVQEDDDKKTLTSPNANYVFSKKSGMMITWGISHKDEAVMFPAPTILDLEITTSCTGVGGRLCPFCYKANNPNGKNMSFETFKTILDKLPKSITQIAFGADSKGTANPDMFKMMEYARSQGIIPNITVAEVSDEVAKKLGKLCGAVAVSRYHDKDIFADSVRRLLDSGIEQVNEHLMISVETFDRAKEAIIDAATDPRLKGLNAIVFLSLKTKGRGKSHNVLSQEQFNELVAMCKEYGIGYGFDSCSSLKFFNSLSQREYEVVGSLIQPCESTLESSYIDVEGNFFPCSFTEGTEGWENGISVLDSEDFVRDIWNNERVKDFRKRLLATKKNNKFSCRECPLYVI